MSRADVYTALQSVFGDVLGREGVVLQDATTARDVAGWDSLRHIDLITAVEARFAIRFSVREVQRLPNVGALVDLNREEARGLSGGPACRFSSSDSSRPSCCLR
jgi:acyl carrier protein